MMDDIIKVLEVLPPILWIVVVIIVLVIFRRTIRDELLPRLSSFKAMGVELSFVEDSIDSAIGVAEKTTGRHIVIPEDEKQRALRQAIRHVDVFRGRRILWVDDIPANNRNERRMFSSLGVSFDNAISTEKGLARLEIDDFDCIISDMRRDEGKGDNNQAGMEFINSLRTRGDNTPVVFYIGADPKGEPPPSSVGITHRPDKLLLLVLRALQGTTKGGGF
jgi:CheY-like chemotaxis protein